MKLLYVISIQVFLLMPLLLAKDLGNVDRITIRDSAGWVISIYSNGSAVIFQSDNLDISAELPDGTYSFAALLKAIKVDDGRPSSLKEQRYAAAFSAGSCEAHYYWTDQQKICDTAFQKAIRELANASSGPAVLVRNELSKNHR